MKEESSIACGFPAQMFQFAANIQNWFVFAVGLLTLEKNKKEEDVFMFRQEYERIIYMRIMLIKNSEPSLALHVLEI